jgi:hypothetical protein
MSTQESTMFTRSFKPVLAALALVAAAPANALVQTYSSGNGELLFNLYDPTGTPVSFYFDLKPRAGFGSLAINDFLPRGAADPDGTGPSVPGIATRSQTRLTWVIDDSVAGFSDFKRIADVQQQSSWKWNVVAGDSTGQPTGNQAHRYLSTTQAPLSQVQTQSNTNLVGFNVTSAYVNAVNAASGADADASGIVLDTAGLTGGYFGEGFQDNWLVKAVFDSTAGVGEEMDFFYLFSRPSSTAGAIQFENRRGDDATWKFEDIGNGAYLLSYSVPVSEPGTLAALLGGLGILGAARRRRAS